MNNANKPYGSWGGTTTLMTEDERAELRAFNLAHPLLPGSHQELARREALRTAEVTSTLIADDPA